MRAAVLDTGGFVSELAKRMPLTEVEILAHLKRTELVDFVPFTYAFLRGRHLPQAIVTVNPAAFSEIVVPAFASTKSPTPSLFPQRRRRLVRENSVAELLSD